jgi:hypothetical protein
MLGTLVPHGTDNTAINLPLSHPMRKKLFVTKLTNHIHLTPPWSYCPKTIPPKKYFEEGNGGGLSY